MVRIQRTNPACYVETAKDGDFAMKIIHSSDWHLGAVLHEESRHPEHIKFLQWLKELLRDEKPDALIVSGDIFDTYSPPNASQELYYSFLGEIASQKICGKIVIVAGNHDSSALLDSPEKIMNHIGVKVVGAADIEKESVVLIGKDGRPGLAIGAVPYLRDADVRLSSAGETFAESSERLRAGIKRHYDELARRLRESAGDGVPLVMTGHFFLSKSKLSDDVSERTRSVGGIGEICLDLLPAADYYALGHLHIPQALGGNEFCRYSGSPIPMSFAEAAQKKSLAIIEFGPNPGLRIMPIPCFQHLEQIKGSTEKIVSRIKELLCASSDVWLELQVDEHEGSLADFWSSLPSLVEGSAVKILARQDMRPHQAWGSRGGDDRPLDTIRPEDVFKMRLEYENLNDEEKAEFASIFKEIVKDIDLKEVQEGQIL